MEHSDARVIAASVDTPAAFAAIFERHFLSIHGYLSRRLSVSLADDLAGQAFAIAFERRMSFVAQHDTARPWLYGIATNLVHRHLRDERRKARAVEAQISQAVPTGNPFLEVEERLDAKRSLAALHGALTQLTVADRDALLLYAVEGLTYEEIASALETPLGTVRSRIHRARGQLRALLFPEDSPIQRASEGGT